MIIGIIGKKRAGKDTIANYLVQHYNFEKGSFARPMKDACKIIFDWTEEHVNGKLKEKIDKRWGISPRQALQRIGTEFAQIDLCNAFPEFKEKTGRSLWVKRLCDEYKKSEMKKDMCIADVRFAHEQEYIKSFAKKNKIVCYFLRVDRFSNVEITNEDKHLSENEINLMTYDRKIENNSSVSQLKHKIEFFMNTIRVPYV